MNREILFRGKRVDNGEFIEGCYFKRWTGARYKHYIIDWLIEYEVIPETVGQFTGLHDKNGNEIYEGDIILWGDKTARARGTAARVVVEFRSGCFGILCGKRFHEFWQYIAEKWEEKEITDDMWGEMPIAEYFRACFEVVGNRWDNPELCDALFEAVKQVLGG